MRARILTAVVGVVFVLGSASAASAVSLEEGLTNLGNCDTDVQRPEITDRDVDKKADKVEQADRSLLPDLYTPGMGSDADEDYRPLRGGLLSDGEDRPTKSSKDKAERDTNNLDADGGLSILCN